MENLILDNVQLLFESAQELDASPIFCGTLHACPSIQSEELNDKVHAAINARLEKELLPPQGTRLGAALQYRRLVVRNRKVGLDWESIRAGTDLTLKQTRALLESFCFKFGVRMSFEQIAEMKKAVLQRKKRGDYERAQMIVDLRGRWPDVEPKDIRNRLRMAETDADKALEDDRLRK